MSFKFTLPFLVAEEVGFLERYGYAIPPALNRDAIDQCKDDERELLRIYDQLRQLPAPTTSYCTTSELVAIRDARPATTASDLRVPSDAELHDRILGGWLGRAAGCILGKPLECALTLPMIKDFLGADFPLDNYLRLSTATNIVLQRKPKLHPAVTVPCSREHVAYAMPDDDLNYTVLNLLLLEEKSYAFSTSDIGATWVTYLPLGSTYGAETTAFINYASGLPTEQIPVHLNPFRDEIGAQIRADMFGYVCPAQPQTAAELAFRDAAFSHVADGIYGAMFAAAMIAAAFSTDSMPEIVAAGLAQIPARSRLAALVTQTVEWHTQQIGWEAVYEKIKVATPQYHAGHTVNNAAYVVNALLASHGDFEQGICIASMQGHDTDCNGATVGSVLGVCLGAARLPDKWIAPLHDCLKTKLNGMSSVTISELAARTVRLITPQETGR